MAAGDVISSDIFLTHDAKSSGMSDGGMGSFSQDVRRAHIRSTSFTSGGTTRLRCAFETNADADREPASAAPVVGGAAAIGGAPTNASDELAQARATMIPAARPLIIRAARHADGFDGFIGSLKSMR
jgi:hypothetical protein